jgi:hypothetical protein
MNVVAAQHVLEPAEFVHHFRGAGSHAREDVADHMVVFVEEDVAAIEIWQETEVGQADGLPFLQGNVMMFVLWSPNALCFESAV